MKYYSLLQKQVNQNANLWSVEFGDYDKEVVKQEKRDMLDSDIDLKAKDIRIVSHDEEASPAMIMSL